MTSRSHDRPLPRCRICAAGIPHELNHGSINGYNFHRCRCSRCSTVWNTYQRDWVNRNLEKNRAYRRDYQRRSRAR
jgi:hypothetical protein